MKTETILNHFKYKIDNHLFDEYDILGFLIFIREQIKDICPYIHEFTNLIAHRNRDRGIIQSNIVKCIQSGYATDDKNRVIGYNGIEWNEWVNEWINISKKFHIDSLEDEKIVIEITICIISLAQDTKYYKEEKIIGKVEPFIDGKKYLTLVTSENRIDSPMVCLIKIGPFDNIIDENYGFFDYPIEVIRNNKVLCIIYNTKCILSL